MKKEHLTLEDIREKRHLKNLEQEEAKKIAIRDEILEFMEYESEYTKKHKLFIANEMISIINKHN